MPYTLRPTPYALLPSALQYSGIIQVEISSEKILFYFLARNWFIYYQTRIDSKK